MSRRRHAEPAALPLHEELDALARYLIDVHFDLTPRGRRALAAA